MKPHRFLSVLLLIVAQTAFAQGVRTVVIDAGHGGKDPGCTWKNTVLEKDINLDVALLLGNMIKEQMPEVKVLYTRTTDVFVPLDERGKVANDAKADLYISIHVNSTEAAEGPSGAETIIMSIGNEAKNFQMATRENDVIMYEDDYKTKYAEYLSGSPEMFIIYSLMQGANIDRSLSFATAVQRNFKSETSIPDFGVRRQSVMVLWFTTMPSALIEIGFMNNTHDRGVLTTRAGRQQIAEAIFGGFKEYSDRQAAKDVAQQGGVAAPADDDKELVITDKPIARPRPVERVVVSTPIDQVEEKLNAQRGAKPTESATGAWAIQIMNTSRKVPANHPEFKGLRPIERYGKGRYKYYYKRYDTRAAAQAELETVRKKFKDAFITTL